MSDTLTPEQQVVQNRIDKVAPLRALVDTEGFDALLDGLRDVRPALLDDPLFPHVSGLLTIMGNLKGAVAKEPTEVPPAPEEIAPQAPPAS